MKNKNFNIFDEMFDWFIVLLVVLSILYMLIKALTA